MDEFLGNIIKQVVLDTSDTGVVSHLLAYLSVLVDQLLSCFCLQFNGVPKFLSEFDLKQDIQGGSRRRRRRSEEGEEPEGGAIALKYHDISVQGILKYCWRLPLRWHRGAGARLPKHIRKRKPVEKELLHSPSGVLYKPKQRPEGKGSSYIILVRFAKHSILYSPCAVGFDRKFLYNPCDIRYHPMSPCHNKLESRR